MNHHHEHGYMVQVGPNDWDPDVECCICSANPCDAVTVDMAIEHERAELDRQRDHFEGEIRHILEHGERMPCPF